MGLGDTMPAESLDSFAQEGMFVGFCCSGETENGLLSSMHTVEGQLAYGEVGLFVSSVYKNG